MEVNRIDDLYNRYVKEYQDSQNLPAVEEEPTRVDWLHNHGKFVHEFTWKRYNKKLRDWSTSMYNNLNARISRTVAYFKLHVIRLDKRVDEESERAKDAEATLQENINKENKRALSAEGELSAMINSEIDRAEGEESRLDDRATENKNAIEANTANIQNNAKSIDDLKALVAGMDSTINDLKTQISNLQSTNK